jgi:hypothetical protein
MKESTVNVSASLSLSNIIFLKNETPLERVEWWMSLTKKDVILREILCSERKLTKYYTHTLTRKRER